jgi:Family of unknown function (DUF6516)
MARARDRTLDTLLDLDGTTFFADRDGIYRVQFVVKQVEHSPERPHGLSYSLTLHDEKGDRIAGFDNAHPVPVRSGPSGRQRVEHDHRHRFRTIRPYNYTDAAALLADFWEQADSVLREIGVIP